MSAAHTPGPWFVYSQHADRFTVGNYARGSLCRVTADCSPRRVITAAGDDSMTDVECAANARLIAAAPDLYALAVMYAGECGECAGTRVCPDDEPCTECAFIWKVIDKVEGRT